MPPLITIESQENIATIFLNRPEAFNSFNLEMIGSLSDQLITLAADPTIRALVITGAGKAFCAGGDLKWVVNFPQGPPAAFHELAARFHQAILEIRRMAKPVIAAINGIAAGGGFSLALACDFRVMAESALLRQAYTSNGLSIDGGGSFTLPRLVGAARAMEIMAFDSPISAVQALSWGLVTKIVKDEEVLEAARVMARELTRKSLTSFAWSKKLITDAFDTSFETQMERERRAISSCAAHPEGKEGLKAFTEKRKPVFNR
ncbi:MAG: enoyl-CoA hydratase-related protein [Thermodesulfobacteriota bacterium]